MSETNPLGFGLRRRLRGTDQLTEHVVVRQPLRRVLAFIGRSIDDVVNDPIAKNQVFAYFKLHRQVERASEVVELERQWNPGAQRF